VVDPSGYIPAVGVADASDCGKRLFTAKPAHDLKLWAIT